MDLFIPEEIKKISATLNKAGFQCYLVGGAIRNQLLRREAKDYDLTTDARPEEVTRLFRRVIPTGIKHGTVTILIGTESFEITTYRIDGKYSDGRRPDIIEFTPSIEEDLIRRDFTINSLAYNIEEGAILDINNGIEDLNNSIIRAIGDPAKRFDEDALRLVRACRFASQLDFKIEISTYKAMCTTLGKLGDVSRERICDELLKILKSNKPSIAFNHFYDCGMLEILFPEIYYAAKNNYNTFQKAITDMDAISSDKSYIKFTRLLAITNKDHYHLQLKNLKLPNDFIKRTIHLLEFIDRDIAAYKSEYDIRKLISSVTTESIEDLLTLWKGHSKIDSYTLKLLKEKIRFEIKSGAPFSLKELNISGNDLIKELNLSPGPQLGKILNSIMEDVLIDPTVNNRDKLIKIAEKYK